MKLICYLICFVMSLLMVGCGGDEDEPVTEDKPDTSPLPVANFIRSEPPNGSYIDITDALDTPIEIRLFFDHAPTFVAVGGVPAQIHSNLAIWEVSTEEFLDLVEHNEMNDWDLSVTWKDPDGSERKTVLTFEVGYGGKPPEIIASTLRDGDQDVDPHFLNLSGIIFVFDEEVIGRIVILPKDGKPLNWSVEWSAGERHGAAVAIKPKRGEELQHGVIYVIEIDVQDGSGNGLPVTITFSTEDE